MEVFHLHLCFILCRLKKDEEPSVSNGVSAVTDSIARLDVDSVAESNSEPTVKKLSTQSVLECKCGMPLCICEAPPPPKVSIPVLAVPFF